VIRSRWTVFLHDLLWIPLAVLLAYWVRFNLTAIPHLYFSGMLLVMSLALPAHAVTLWMFVAIAASGATPRCRTWCASSSRWCWAHWPLSSVLSCFERLQGNTALGVDAVVHDPSMAGSCPAIWRHRLAPMDRPPPVTTARLPRRKSEMVLLSAPPRATTADGHGRADSCVSAVTVSRRQGECRGGVAGRGTAALRRYVHIVAPSRCHGLARPGRAGEQMFNVGAKGAVSVTPPRRTRTGPWAAWFLAACDPGPGRTEWAATVVADQQRHRRLIRAGLAAGSWRSLTARLRPCRACRQHRHKTPCRYRDTASTPSAVCLQALEQESTEEVASAPTPPT